METVKKELTLSLPTWVYEVFEKEVRDSTPEQFIESVLTQKAYELKDGVIVETLKDFTSTPVDSWVKASERLPGYGKPVEWRNHDGGDIPLGKYTVIEMYHKAGPNSWGFEWLEQLPSPSKGVEDEQAEQMAEALKEGKSNDWHLGNIARVKEMAELQNNLNDFKEECERLAGLVKFWQEEYYKINPNYTPPKIDNL